MDRARIAGWALLGVAVGLVALGIDAIGESNVSCEDQPPSRHGSGLLPAMGDPTSARSGWPAGRPRSSCSKLAPTSAGARPAPSLTLLGVVIPVGGIVTAHRAR